MPYFERLDAGEFRIVRLQPGDHLPGLIAQPPVLIEFRTVTGLYEVAIAGRHRKLAAQCRVEFRGQGDIALRQQALQGAEAFRQSADTRSTGQHLCKPCRARQRVPHPRQIARSAAADGDAAERPRQIGQRRQQRPDFFAKPRFIDETGNFIEPGADRRRIEQRVGEPRGQRPRSRRRHREIDDREQAALLGPGQGARQFEIGPGGGIDQQTRGGKFKPRLAQMRHAARLRHHDIVEKPAQGGDLRALEAAEAIERRNPEMSFQALLGGDRIEPRRGQWRHRGAGAVEQQGEFRLGQQPVRDDDFPGSEARQIGAEPERAGRHHREFPGTDIRPGQRHAA